MKELPMRLIEQDDGSVQVIADPSVSGSQLAAAIRALGRLRETTAPPPATEPPMNVPNGIEVAQGREWQLVNMLDGTPALLVLHPMYGWLAFRAGPQVAQAFADQLEKWLTSRPVPGRPH